MIQVKNLAKEFGDRILFQGVNFNLSEGEKIGLVGRNGSGKSTLLKIIMGEVLPDDGEVLFPKNYTLGYLSQHIAFSHDTVLKEALSAIKIDDESENYKAEKILSGLGFSKEDFQKSPTSFSGGYQLRINLSKALLKEPNLLLLDEPTNYLDILSIKFLERFLKNYPGEIILITHDRSFMDAITNSTMGIHREKLVKIQGNSKKFKEKIIEEEKVYENTRLNQEKKRKEIEDFVNKFRAKARQASLAQSRMKMLEKMEEYEKLSSVSTLDFSFTYKEIQAKCLVNISKLSFSYEKKKILENLSFQIEKGDRIGVIGKNGRGKTTLLRLITGELQPQKGELSFHPLTSIGYFGQTNIERLYKKNTIEEEIALENEKHPYSKIKAICGTMMFSGDDSKKTIEVLSGGEKSRVLLGKILAKEVNLLLLDEPTNHLDQESIEVLGDEIKKFSGGSLIVTHNEDLLNKVCNKLIVFKKEGPEIFLGSYDDFLKKIGWEEDGNIHELKKDKNKLSHKEIKIKRAELIKERSLATKELKKTIESLETEIFQKEEKIEILRSKIFELSQSSQGQEIGALSKNLGELEKNVEELFNSFEEKSIELQIIEKDFELKLGELS